jgi:hypothetical protein
MWWLSAGFDNRDRWYVTKVEIELCRKLELVYFVIICEWIKRQSMAGRSCSSGG